MDAVSTKRKKQLKKRKNIALRLFFIFLLCLGAYSLAMLTREPVATETVRYGTMEDKLETKGYILRKETVINSPADGMVSCAVSEGERVNKNTKILTVFEGKIDENLQSKIANINDKIERLERSETKKSLIIGDIIQIENAIAKTVESVVDAAYQKDAEKISEFKIDLENILTQRMKELGGEVQKVDKAEQLAEEKRRLEAESSGKRVNVYAPVPGVFSTEIDGFEGYFNLSDFADMSADLLERADSFSYKKEKTAKTGSGVAKIIDNYEWFYASAVDAKWAWDLQEGSYIMLRFPEFSNKTLDANVDYISDEKDGKVTVVIACMQCIDNIYSARRVNVEIIKKRFSGFKVPINAVRIKEEGTSGVYISKENIALFKTVEMLYKGEEYVIVKENNNAKNALLLYDEVIISGNNISEGKVVR